MNNQYQTTAIAVKNAEKALETLQNFAESQYEAKGETMLEQIVDYIVNVLEDAHYMCCGCKHDHLALSNPKDRFVFYIYSGGALNSGYPIFRIQPNDGIVTHIRDLDENMMLTLIKEWTDFKIELNMAIKTTLKEKTKNINNQLSHIGYVNEQLLKWHI